MGGDEHVQIVESKYVFERKRGEARIFSFN